MPSDMLDGYSLKLIAPIVLMAILHIINLSILNSTFDGSWKTQIVIPNHKKGERDLLENYRPVSNLVELSKLTEMAVHDQFIDHFTQHNLFHPNHHGSLPLHDTTTALLQVNDFMLRAADEKKLCGTLFIDQSSAFDLVDHGILLAKLGLYNFTPQTLKWFESYLSNRSFQVQVETKRSKVVRQGPLGVPQGSVLGSLLFVVRQNDLPAATQSDTGQSVVYVDDDSEQESADSSQQLQERLQRRANNVTDWLGDNKMVVAQAKTKLLVSATTELRTARSVDQISIKVGNVTVLGTRSEKLLGIVLCQDLKWSTHLWGETWR